MKMAPRCIWCLKSPAVSLEHIIPDSLGCPPALVLHVGVCSLCNHANGRLDRALLTPFELMTVVRGIPRKKGKRPTIDSYSSVSSRQADTGPEIYINRERYRITPPFGKKLGPTSHKDPFHDVSLERLSNGRANLHVKQRLQFDRDAVRGLFKIALESIALNQGVEATLDSQFDAVRNFCRSHRYLPRG